MAAFVVSAFVLAMLPGPASYSAKRHTVKLLSAPHTTVCSFQEQVLPYNLVMRPSGVRAPWLASTPTRPLSASDDDGCPLKTSRLAPLTRTAAPPRSSGLRVEFPRASYTRLSGVPVALVTRIRS